MPDRVWPDFTYKHIAVALQGRRLAKVSKRGWHAEVTEDGRFYLAHNRYPDESPQTVHPRTMHPTRQKPARREEPPVEIREAILDELDRVLAAASNELGSDVRLKIDSPVNAGVIQSCYRALEEGTQSFSEVFKTLDFI